MHQPVVKASRSALVLLAFLLLACATDEHAHEADKSMPSRSARSLTAVAFCGP